MLACSSCTVADAAPPSYAAPCDPTCAAPAACDLDLRAPGELRSGWPDLRPLRPVLRLVLLRAAPACCAPPPAECCAPSKLLRCP